MREVAAEAVACEVERLFLHASYAIGEDVEAAVRSGLERETSPAGCAALRQIAENYRIAREERVAICQDTGMAVVFADVGQDVHIVSGGFEDAVNEGVRRAYTGGYLRKSVVAEPLFDRVNTKDNTPAVLHARIVPGDKLRLLVVPKGFGSENMSRVKMLTPADGVEGVKRFVIETVTEAGPNPCPPVIVGVGIGGTMEMAALMAKRQTARPVGSRHADARYAGLEEEMLAAVNRSGVGPAGTGGRVTALAVHAEYYPTHIAGLPVAVNVCCHAARHAEGVL
ncbi:MAG: fumarate hydratase [Firmicutes bacterium]|nr:fumarate hydratase [Bacillota bacterium]